MSPAEKVFVESLGTYDDFDAVEQASNVITWIEKWFERNGKGCNAVIGISGGKDSTVTAALCAKALGKDRVIGVLMPNGVQPDIQDSYDVINFLGIKHFVCNINEAVGAIGKSVTQYISLTDQAVTNLPARVRMATLYAVSQSINGRVANTCNFSEDYVGYSTKYGDAAGDFAPLKTFTSDEVILIGNAIGVPQRFIFKTPSDGLCGKTDEDNLGFSYAVLNRYIRTGEIDDEKVKERIDYLNRVNEFKEKIIDRYVYIPKG